MGKKDNSTSFSYNESEMLPHILDNAQVAIVIADNNLIIHRVNHEFIKMFGYSSEEAVGSKINDLIMPEDRSLERTMNVRDRVDSGEKIEFETTRKKKNGTIIDVECRVSPIIKEGEKVGAYTFYTDITKRKLAQKKLLDTQELLEEKVKERTIELESANIKLKEEIRDRKNIQTALDESEERFKTAIENSNDGITILKDGKHLYVNERYLEIYGFNSKEEAYATRVYDLLHPDEREQIKKRAVKRVDEGKMKGQSFENKNLKRDGSTIYVEVSVARTIYNNEPAGMAIIRDINDRKKAEIELKKSKEDAERANLAKSEFLANMSHEIRTPMNAIMGMTGLLLDTQLDEEQMDHLEIIRRSSDALLSIINDILDFSKIEAGKMDLEILDFDFRNSIDEIVALPAMTAQKKGIEFLYEIDPSIPSSLKGDPGRLRQVIINLTNNAVKFTHEGEVHLKVTNEYEDEDGIKMNFSVKDTGIGISKEDSEKLFQSFHQVDASTTRKYGGSGLGLVISKKLVELMGGEIGVKSTPGKGSNFWFTVVLEKQKDIKEEELSPPKDIMGKRFLIIDDNKTNLQILQRYLETWGFICDAAWSGEMALTLMHAAVKAKAPYDVVITDMQMPYMDGKEIGKKIKGDKVLKDTKLIMLSSRGMRGDSADVKKIGFSAYLTKPIRRSQLFDCLVMVFGRKKGMKKTDTSIITQYSVSEARKRNTKILIAEDNIVNQKLALRLVEKFGYKADAVANGEEAVRSLSMIPYDLVLMDVQMPEMDGFEATKKIRNSTSKVINHNVPVVAMTAHAMTGDRKLCLDAGMNDYVAKPINPEELFKTINKYLTTKEE